MGIFFKCICFYCKSISQSAYHTGRCLSLPITRCFPRPLLPSPPSVYPSGCAEEAPDPRGQSSSQGNCNSPQNWYQNSLKCELSDSSQWVQRGPNTSRSRCQQNVNKDGEQVNLLWSCYPRQLEPLFLVLFGSNHGFQDIFSIPTDIAIA